MKYVWTRKGKKIKKTKMDYVIEIIVYLFYVALGLAMIYAFFQVSTLY